MKIQVRFFASLVERTGCRSESLEIAPEADVEALWRELGRLHPELGRLNYRPMVACDQVYAEWDRRLADVHEVAFLPPVSGG